MSRVVVIGGTGFIGGHIAQALRAADHDVATLARGPAADLRVAITSADRLRDALRGASVVVHAAGLSTTDPRRRAALRWVHVRGTEVVVRSAAEAGVGRVVVVSTADTRALGRDPARRFTESDLPDDDLLHVSPVALARREADALAERVARRLGIELVTLLPAVCLGPGGRGLHHDIVRRALGEAPLPRQPRGSVSVVDVRDVALAAVRALQAAPGPYLLGGTSLHVAQLFGRLRGSPRRGGFLSPAAWRALRLLDLHRCVDDRRARERLGHAPRRLDLTLADAVRPPSDRGARRPRTASTRRERAPRGAGPSR